MYKCVSRKSRGYRLFRDFWIYNQAMLAKHNWRIIKNPDYLLARVPKGRYIYFYKDFLKAKLGHNLSYTWRSILWGRDLFVKGMRWYVRNGTKILIVEDSLIPNSGNFKPSYAHDKAKNKKVYFFSFLRWVFRMKTWLRSCVYRQDDAINIPSILIRCKKIENWVLWALIKTKIPLGDKKVGNFFEVISQ